MKRFATGAVLSFLMLALFGCAGKIEPRPASPPKQIFEITSDYRGLWWMEGKVVDFRLFDDGSAEYDEYPLSSDKEGVLKADEVKSVKRVSIEKKELDAFFALLKSNDVFKSKSELKPSKSCLDNFIDTKINITIDGQTTDILINGHCINPASTERTDYMFDKFPIALNELFQKIDRVRDRHSPGKFNR